MIDNFVSKCYSLAHYGFRGIMDNNKLSKEVELLSNIAKSLAESLDLKETIDSIFSQLESYLDLQMGTISLHDPETETLRAVIAHGISEEDKKHGVYKVGEGITGTVFETGEAVIVPDIDKDLRFLGKTARRKSRSGGKVAFFCVPIKLDNKTVGTLSVSRETRHFDNFHANLNLLNVIATMVAQAIKLNKKVNNELQIWRDENRKLREQLKSKFTVNNMVGTSNAMQKVSHLIEQVAHSNATVMIRGESGTGKDLVAHAIHYSSLRSEKPFIKINCMALPETLLESELFGHERGAFTGALERKIGRFEMANGGTIFLDEIGDFSLSLQIKLLRIIQFKEFERLGGTETIKANLRIIVATNKNLEEEIQNGLFREDLYYRINVFPIYLPALRERKDDIILLADHFVLKFAQENNKNITRISTTAIDMLTNYHWPGNVRELENCIERAILLCNGNTIRAEHLPPSLQMVRSDSVPARTLPEMVENLEREMIIDALKKTNGQQRKAAELLGLTQRMMGYKVKKYKIKPKQLVY